MTDEIDVLRMIFMVNERAVFEFVVTEASLHEVVNHARPSYSQWVYEVLDAWTAQFEEEEESPTPRKTFEDRRFGMISAKDRRLLQDALDWYCYAFMTMERRLPIAAFIQQETGVRVFRPTVY